MSKNSRRKHETPEWEEPVDDEDDDQEQDDE